MVVFVMAGLDPAIQTIVRELNLVHALDGRLEGGYDDRME